MSTYQELKGLKIKYLSSDTSGDRAIEGEVFYNSASGKVASHIATGAWSAGAPMFTGRNDLAGFGTQTATACFGGVDATAVSNDTEEYNGSGWSAGEDMPSAIYEHAGTGTLTAGLSVGGTLPGGITNVTNEYDGTDWAAGGTYPAATIRLQACGTQTAALAAGGGRPTISAVVCEYNGSAWTANPSPSGDLPAAIQYHRMTGILTSAVSFGGGPSGPVTGATATYNGTAWTAQTATLNDTRSRLGGAGETDSSAVAFGGFAPNGTVNTELWDGSSWTEVANMGTARYALAGTGTKTSALGSGGYTSGRLSATEEFNLSINTITAGAWSSGGNMNTARGYIAGFGVQTSAVAAGGYNGTARVSNVEEYNGSAWSNATALPGAYAYGGGAGTEPAGLHWGGTNPGGAVNTTFEYDGSSWTSGGNLSEAKYNTGSAGTQTAALAAGGVPPDNTPPYTNDTEEYDGSSWTAGGDMNTHSQAMGGAGTQTAGVMFGRGAIPSDDDKNIEEYNGSSWTTSPAKMQVCEEFSASSQNAPSSDSIIFGDSSTIVSTEQWNGTVCVTAPNLAAARNKAGGAGTGSSGLAFGGLTPGAINTTEEFAAGSSALGTAKTIDFD